MDLYCTSTIETSLIGSVFLFGIFFGSFFLPRFADLYGRKIIYLIGLAVYMLDCVGFLLCKNLYFLYVLLFIGGVAEVGTFDIGFVYAVELVPKKHQFFTGLALFFIFALVKMFFAVYFW